MTNQVAEVNAQKVIGNFTQLELNTLQNTIAVGTTREQFELFVQTCVNSGLNPFLNHVYCIVYGGKMSIQVSVEGVLHLARQRPGYQGVDVQLIHEHDDFEAERNENGEWKITSHKVKFPRGKVMACYAVAQREGFKDVIVFMEVNEVEHQKNGRNATMWKTWFNDMFKKHVAKRAAKLQYGIEINEDEPIISASDEVESYERRDITPGMVEIGEGERIDPAEELKKQWDAIAEKTEKYGLEKSDITKIVKANFKVPSKELTLQQVVALSKLVDIFYKDRQKEQPIEAEIVERNEEPEHETEPPVEEPYMEENLSFEDFTLED